MTSTSTGRQAEQRVAEKLRLEGHTILALNWRTRWCEIDIVSKKSQVVYFTEVKYRHNDSFGSGFDYINRRKQDKMQFAAEFWVTSQQWSGDVEMLAAEVDSTGQITIVAL